jgi:hypothetical protein
LLVRSQRARVAVVLLIVRLMQQPALPSVRKLAVQKRLVQPSVLKLAAQTRPAQLSVRKLAAQKMLLL